MSKQNRKKERKYACNNTQNGHPAQWNTSNGKGKKRATEPLL